MNKYDDIINLSRPVSKRSKMSIENRAFQFAPFSALVGYEDAIKETARFTEKHGYFTEEVKMVINDKLNYIYNNMNSVGQVEIVYFLKDKKKSGGKYLKENCKLKKIDAYKKSIILSDGKEISFDDIKSISLNI